ncbi:MAG TPA: CRTAC1 family protein [Thermoanaerobaculia bacterium]
MKRTLYVPAILLVMTSTAWADGGVSFTHISQDGGAGIAYARVPSPRAQEVEDLRNGPPLPTAEFFSVARPNLAQKPNGAPGVALLDFDGDGDLDIYVTNGPGAANSLYSNQSVEGGGLTFVDVAVAAGAAATEQDSSGVCFGDVDNDGDEDLYVLGTGVPNILFENQGDGTFTDVTATAGVGGEGRHAVACSFADFNNDGLLDVVVGNSFNDWSHRRPVFLNPAPLPHYPEMEHSYLFFNTGGNVFTDVSAAAGLESVSNMAGEGLSGAAFTWALASADYDQDGDVDILFADNQGFPPLDESQERGYLRLYDNDGAGNFTEVTYHAGLDVPGGWMGLDFGDFNCDGLLDFFATDLGMVANAPSRWFLQQPGGVFVDSRAGDLVRTPFGWGTSVFDYDNDGDGDVIFHGGIEVVQFAFNHNPGSLLQNTGNCEANFRWDSGAVPFDHRNRVVEGVAVGDLNLDGFEDIVSVSSSEVDFTGDFTIPTPLLTGPTRSPFDIISVIELFFTGTINPGFQTYVPHTFRPGNLAVEISSAGNGNNWVELTARGTFGLLPGSRTNRDGIGAVISFTPAGGKTSIRPIIGGSSYASQDALAANFGLGQATYGTADVLWSGGVRNRIVDVRAGERLLVPEIPCDVATREQDRGGYLACVEGALDDLEDAGLIAAADRDRFLRGALSCLPGDEVMCLGDGSAKGSARFQVSVIWTDPATGITQPGKVRTVEGATSGTFYFYEPKIIESHFNLLKGCGINQHYWVFTSATTNLGHTLTVTDTLHGLTKTYTNPAGDLAPAILDTSAFATCP